MVFWISTMKVLDPLAIHPPHYILCDKAITAVWWEFRCSSCYFRHTATNDRTVNHFMHHAPDWYQLRTYLPRELLFGFLIFLYSFPIVTLSVITCVINSHGEPFKYISKCNRASLCLKNILKIKLILNAWQHLSKAKITKAPELDPNHSLH